MRALVTGASRGIGRAVADALLAAHAHVALAVRDASAVAQLTAANQRAHALTVDLLDAAQTESLVDRACSALGGLDALINCAGIVHYTPVSQLTRAQLLEQLEVNFVAPCVLSQRAALQMRATGGGAIVNVASTLGLKPALDTAAYAATKAALISLTQSMALEFGADRVRVNAVAPGVVDTDMIRAPRPTRGEAAMPLAVQLERLRGLHLVGRLGTAEDVAEAVMYLLHAQFVTGTVLTVDGGLLLAE